MKSRRFSLPMYLVFCLSLFFVSILTKASTAQTDAQSVPFKGERLVVQFVRNPQSTQESGGRLEKVQVQRIGNRYFLVGKIVDEGNMKDHMMCVPLNSVTSIVELDNKEMTGDASKASQKDSLNVLFNGKVAGVQFLRSPQTTQEYGSRQEQVRIQKIGDRHFLVGKCLDDNSKGQMMWLPLDKVTAIAELDSVEKTKEAVKTSQRGISATTITPRTQQ